MTHLYHVTNRHEVKETTRFDLFCDEQRVLKQVPYMRAFASLLTAMADEDCYRYTEQPDQREDGDRDLTGLHLRTTHQQRLEELAQREPGPCVRCAGPTTWIGYCDILPYGHHKETQHTFFLECRDCGYYVQTGFHNGDIWQTDSFQRLMQDRIPWVRIASDPFLRNGTLRITSRNPLNPMGRVNLDGHEFHCGEPISVYDQILGRWRKGRVEYGDTWYFIGADTSRDLDLHPGMRARLRGSEYAR